MAITADVSAVLSVGAAGSHTQSFDVGTNPEALVILIGQNGGNHDLDAFLTTVSIGGQTLSYVGETFFIGRNVYAYELIAPTPMSGSQTMQLTHASGWFNADAIGYALHGYGLGMTRADLAYYASAVGSMHVELDSASDYGMGFVVGVSSATSPSVISGTTLDGYTADLHGFFGHETVQGVGARDVGSYSGGSGQAALGLMYTAVSVAYVTFAPYEIEIDADLLGFGGYTDAKIFVETYEIEIDADVLSLRPIYVRDIPLVGGVYAPDRLGPPDGSLTEPVVGYGVYGPEWIENDKATIHWVPLTTEVSGDFELVFDENGELVITEIYA